MAPHKTEAIFFHDGSLGRPPRGVVKVEGDDIKVGAHIKYLGLHLDGAWSFGEHFAQTVPKVIKTAGALSRLLPNLGGPGGRVRRLYVNTVNSVALYGAPVWADAVIASRRIKIQMRRAQRIIALRAARAYRTAAYATATVLAGVPPLELLGQTHSEMYRRVKALREEGIRLTAGARTVLRR